MSSANLLGEDALARRCLLIQRYFSALRDDAGKADLEGEVSRKFAVISLKTEKCLSVSRNKEIIVKFLTNYHPKAIKLSISASGQRQSRPVWIET